MRKQNNIIYKEIVLFLSNSNGYNNIEKDRNVGLLPFPIRGFHYNIPPKIFNKSFLLEQIHLFYRSDEHKVILTQERNDYPLLLTESNETVSNPIRINKFKPWVMCNPHLTFGYDFSLKAGDYFLLFDNMKVNLDEFNKYESLIGIDNDFIFKWRGSNSFSPSYYLSNGMLVLPFRING